VRSASAIALRSFQLTEAERVRILAELAAFRAEELSARARLGVLMGRASLAAGEPLSPPPMHGMPADSATWLATLTPELPRPRRLADEAERYALAARAARGPGGYLIRRSAGSETRTLRAIGLR
jgi:hypothetical protein